MKKSWGRNSGFTLLELLVVVVVVGILASVALPQFQRMILRSRTAEGTNMVGALLTAELVYYQDRNSCTTSTTGDLLVAVPTNGTTWFNYAIPAATSASARVTATGNGITLNGGSVPATVVVTGTINNTGTREITVTGL